MGNGREAANLAKRPMKLLRICLSLRDFLLSCYGLLQKKHCSSGHKESSAYSCAGKIRDCEGQNFKSLLETVVDSFVRHSGLSNYIGR